MFSSYPLCLFLYHLQHAALQLFLPILALIVIIAGGLALYFLLCASRTTTRVQLPSCTMRLTFRTFYTEKLLRALYCITVVAILVCSVVLLFSNLFGALLVFISGNLIARIVYEFALLLLVLCRNAQEINRKMGRLPEEPAAPQAPPQGTVPPSQPQAAQPGAVPPQPPQSHTAPQNNVPPQAPIPPRQEPPQPPQQ